MWRYGQVVLSDWMSPMYYYVLLLWYHQTFWFFYGVLRKIYQSKVNLDQLCVCYILLSEVLCTFYGQKVDSSCTVMVLLAL